MSEHELTEPSQHNTNDAETSKLLEKLYRQAYVKLGGSSILVELEDEDYQTAFELAVSSYRYSGSNSVYKTFGFIQLQVDQQKYKLDANVDNVVKVLRSRGLFGGLGSGSSNFESFGAATANIFLRGGSLGQGGKFDLFTYDLLMQYQKTTDRLFTREIEFTYRPEYNEIYLYQIPRETELVAVECYVLRSYFELLKNHFTYNWLREYTLAELKIILGEKYRKFGQLPSAQGGMTLKGEALITEGRQDKEKMEADLLVYADGGMIPQPTRG